MNGQNKGIAQNFKGGGVMAGNTLIKLYTVDLVLRVWMQVRCDKSVKWYPDGNACLSSVYSNTGKKGHD